MARENMPTIRTAQSFFLGMGLGMRLINVSQGAPFPTSADTVVAVFIILRNLQKKLPGEPFIQGFVLGAGLSFIMNVAGSLFDTPTQQGTHGGFPL